MNDSLNQKLLIILGKRAADLLVGKEPTTLYALICLIEEEKRKFAVEQLEKIKKGNSAILRDKSRNPDHPMVAGATNALNDVDRRIDCAIAELKEGG